MSRGARNGWEGEGASYSAWKHNNRITSHDGYIHCTTTTTTIVRGNAMMTMVCVCKYICNIAAATMTMAAATTAKKGKKANAL